MILEVASGLFLRPFGSKRARRERVVDQMVDGGMLATDGTRRTLLDVDGAELHGLGVERQQTVGQ